MVRHGEKNCSVTIETDDGHTLIWQRKKNSVSYVIDGVDIPRMGRNTPDKLPGALRLALIEPSNTDKVFDLHFGLQKEPIFLIDSPGDAARFFSANNDAERLLQMQQLQKERVRSARGEERRTRTELNRLDGKLAALAPLDELESKLVAAEEQHGILVAAARKIDGLRELISHLERQQRELGRLEALLDRLSALKPIPMLEPVEPLRELHKKLAGAERDARRQVLVSRVLEPLRDLPTLKNDGALRAFIKTYDTALSNTAYNTARVRVWSNLKEAAAPADIGPLRLLIGRIVEASRTVVATVARQVALAPLRDEYNEIILIS